MLLWAGQSPSIYSFEYSRTNKTFAIDGRQPLKMLHKFVGEDGPCEIGVERAGSASVTVKHGVFNTCAFLRIPIQRCRNNLAIGRYPSPTPILDKALIELPPIVAIEEFPLIFSFVGFPIVMTT